MTAQPELLSVNVGLPKNVAWRGKTVYTGVWKYPVDGPAMVRCLNIDGDGQGDLAGHGGEQRAVLVYQAGSYRHWQQHFGRDDLGYGSFGENLTVDGLADDEVCIGDRYRIGAAEFEVTQPRVTCYRVGLRLGEPELPALLVSHHRPGFYMRVLREGRIRAGDRIVKTRTGPGALSVAEADALLYLPGRDLAKLRVATQIPALSPGWQQSFRDLLAGSDAPAAAEPAWAGFRPLRVGKVVPESATVSSIYLAAPDESPLPAARPGQYLTLRVTGAGQPAPVRSYSLSSVPGAGAYRIGAKREPHGVASRYLNGSASSNGTDGRNWIRCPASTRPASPAGVSMATTLPVSISATRSQSRSASSMKWVTRTIVTPRSRTPSISSQVSRRACGSRPVVSSSSTATRGDPSRASAIESRCFWPPDNLANGVLLLLVSPSVSIRACQSAGFR